MPFGLFIGLYRFPEAAILTALQTFLKLEESSESHQKADAKYAAIKERIEQKRALQSESDQDFFNAIREDMRKLHKKFHLSMKNTGKRHVPCYLTISY